jgi:hypothetical protein
LSESLLLSVSLDDPVDLESSLLELLVVVSLLLLLSDDFVEESDDFVEDFESVLDELLPSLSFVEVLGCGA